MKNYTSTRWPKKVTVSYSPCPELVSSSLLLIYQKKYNKVDFELDMRSVLIRSQLSYPAMP